MDRLVAYIIENFENYKEKTIIKYILVAITILSLFLIFLILVWTNKHTNQIEILKDIVNWCFLLFILSCLLLLVANGVEEKKLNEEFQITKMNLFEKIQLEIKKKKLGLEVYLNETHRLLQIYEKEYYEISHYELSIKGRGDKKSIEFSLHFEKNRDSEENEKMANHVQKEARINDKKLEVTQLGKGSWREVVLFSETKKDFSNPEMIKKIAQQIIKCVTDTKKAYIESLNLN